MAVLGRVMELDLADASRVLGVLNPALRPTAVRRLPSQLYEVFEIALDDAPAVILKAFPDRWASWLRKEAYVAGLIGQRPAAPAPRWITVDDSRVLLPLVYGVMTALPGESMRARFGKPEADELYRQMGAMLRTLHEIRMPGFGYIQGDRIERPTDDWAAYMARAFDRNFRNFGRRGAEPKLVAALEAAVSDRAWAMAECRDAVLCHNDFHPGNVLAMNGPNGWRLSGLIDFENALSGDPLFDLAKALDFTAHEDAAGSAPLAEGYGALERPGSAEAIFAYRLYHKLELWNWFAELGQDPDAEGPGGLMRDLVAMAG